MLLFGDAVSVIEVTTEDADKAREIMAPVAESLNGRAVVTVWQELNASLFEALNVERVAMAFALGIIVLVAAFNILSSLVMLVRSKTRDIAIRITSYNVCYTKLLRRVVEQRTALVELRWSPQASPAHGG